MILLALALGAALAAPPLPGQDDYALPALDAEPWRPALASGHFLTTEEVRADSPFTGRVDLRWAHQPLLYELTPDQVVGVLDEALAVDLSATWALGPLRVGAWAPAYVYTWSESTDSRGSALGDGRVQALYALADQDFGLGLRLAVGVPLGGVHRALGQAGVSGEAALVADADAGPVRLAGELGWADGSQVELTPDQAAGGSLDLRLGAAWLAGSHTSLALELVGSWTPSLPGIEAWPLEAVLGASHRRPGGRTLRGGASVAITPGLGAPTFRLMLGAGHLPRSAED